MERVFDLDAGRTVAAVRLSGCEFRIARVVIAARVLYSNHLRTISSLLKDAGALEAGGMDAGELERRYSEYAERTPDVLLEVVRAILEPNGIAYDDAWWRTHADVADLRGFIDACMSKDADDRGKDKKKD